MALSLVISAMMLSIHQSVAPFTRKSQMASCVPHGCDVVQRLLGSLASVSQKAAVSGAAFA